MVYEAFLRYSYKECWVSAKRLRMLHTQVSSWMKDVELCVLSEVNVCMGRVQIRNEGNTDSQALC